MMAKTVQCHVSDEVYEWLKKIAAQNERSIAAQLRHYVRISLTDDLGRDPEGKDDNEE